MKKPNPAAAVTANGAANDAMYTIDCGSKTSEPQYIVPQAVSRLVRQFGFTRPTAQTVCCLSGFGGRHAS